MPQYFVVYKPFGIVSRFGPDDQGALHSLGGFPRGVYPVGRLDRDSEGLLILTNDPELNHRLLHPGFQHEREYWVQVEGNIGTAALNSLASGVRINAGGKSYFTMPAIAEAFAEPPPVFPRVPPIRFRKSIADRWIRVVLREGKNRQVRRMAAAVGFPVLRLIRFRIQGLTLQDMVPGEVSTWQSKDLYQVLFPLEGNQSWSSGGKKP